MLLYLTKIPTTQQMAFSQKVARIAQELRVNANWLMQVMYSESRLKPDAYNSQSGAAGLIQLLPSTAKLLGTTTQLLLSMDAVEQLDYVRKYYLPYIGKMKSYFDVYLATFFPLGIGKPDNWIFQSSNLSASIIAQQNPAINADGDNQITIAEFKQYLLRTVPEDFRRIIFATGGAASLAFLLFVGAAAAAYYKNFNR